MGKHPVLLADDDIALRETLGELFSRMGFRILEAADGISALRLARSEAPSFSLLDFHMPGLSGLEVIKALRQDSLRKAQGSSLAAGRLPCILMSADASQRERSQALGEGAFCVLRKPLNIESLFSSVTELMQHFILETDEHIFEKFSFSFEFQCETRIIGPIREEGSLLPAPLSSLPLFFKKLDEWFRSLQADRRAAEKGERSKDDDSEGKRRRNT